MLGIVVDLNQFYEMLLSSSTNVIITECDLNVISSCIINGVFLNSSVLLFRIEYSRYCCKFQREGQSSSYN